MVSTVSSALSAGQTECQVFMDEKIRFHQKLQNVLATISRIFGVFHALHRHNAPAPHLRPAVVPTYATHRMAVWRCVRAPCSTKDDRHREPSGRSTDCKLSRPRGKQCITRHQLAQKVHSGPEPRRPSDSTVQDSGHAPHPAELRKQAQSQPMFCSTSISYAWAES